ncbi:MAG: hypothetical protein RIG66_28280 [Coleofasciculus sp. E2-BRE-01]
MPNPDELIAILDRILNGSRDESEVAQLRLTTNPLTSGEGISYRTEQVYVPLGLVERKLSQKNLIRF